MVTQSEAALEQGLIKTLQDMSYEYVKIEEETNLDQNFKTQLEKHNNRVGGKRSSFSPTFVFRPLTPPYMRFRIRRFLFWVPFEV